MVLHKESNRTASWNQPEERWMISVEERYRWMSNDEKSNASPWLNDIEQALEWIKAYDIERVKGSIQYNVS
jgi:hypothetical protein